MHLKFVCLFISLSLSPFVWPCGFASLWPSVCLSLHSSDQTPVYLSVHLPVCSSVYSSHHKVFSLSDSLLLCLSVPSSVWKNAICPTSTCLFVCPSLHPIICLFICLSVRFVCLSIHPSIHICIYLHAYFFHMFVCHSILSILFTHPLSACQSFCLSIYP